MNHFFALSVRSLSISVGSLGVWLAGGAIATEPASSVAEQLPDSVGAVILLRTGSEAWSALGQFFPAPPGSIAGPGGLPYVPTELDFATQVQPWIEEWVAVAVVPTTLAAPTVDTQTLAVLPIGNEAGAEAFVAAVRDLRGVPQAETEYAGATVTVWDAVVLPICDPEDTSLQPPDCVEEFPAPAPPAPMQFLPEPATKFLSKQLQQPFWTSATWETPLLLPLLALNQLGQATETEAQEVEVPIIPKPEAPKPQPEASEEPRFKQVQPPLAIAALPDRILMSSSPEAIQQFIEAEQDADPLAEDDRFQRALAHPEVGRSLVILYANPSALPEVDLQATSAAPAFASIMASFYTAATQYDSMEGWGWLQEDGLRVQAQAYYLEPSPDKATVMPEGTSILTQIPQTTFATFASRDLSRQWQQVVENVGENDVFLGKLRERVQATLGLDLDRDVVRWIDGDYGMFLFSTNRGFFANILPQLSLGMGAIAQTSDRVAAEQFLRKLDKWVTQTSQGNVSVIPTQLNGREAVAWAFSAPNAPPEAMQSLVAYTWLDDNTLMFATGLEVLQQLTEPEFSSLADSTLFQSAIAPFPQPNGGYFYLDFQALVSLIGNFVGFGFDPASSDALKPLAALQTLSVSGSSTTEVERADVFLRLSPQALQETQTLP